MIFYTFQQYQSKLYLFNYFNFQFFYFLFSFILGLILMYVIRIDLNDQYKQHKLDYIDNCVICLLFILAIFNIFIAACSQCYHVFFPVNSIIQNFRMSFSLLFFFCSRFICKQKKKYTYKKICIVKTNNYIEYFSQNDSIGICMSIQ